MSGDVTVCFYLVIGACVAVALWMAEPGAMRGGRVYQASTALLFWPVYLPVLLAAHGTLTHRIDALERDAHQNAPPQDEMATAIGQVEVELDTALCSLNGWAEETLYAEAGRFTELRLAWRQQAERIRELDRLLLESESEAVSSAVLRPDAANAAGEAPLATDPVLAASSAGRITMSEQSRRENLAQLKLVREQRHGDLLATLAWVRQLVTKIHLARYTGEPASRAAELVQQIAKVVEGLSQQTTRS